MLFADLPVPSDANAWHRATGRRQTVCATPAAEQLAFTFRLRELENDLHDDWEVVHRHASAGEVERPVTTAPRSIFDLGAMYRGKRLDQSFAAGLRPDDKPAKLQRVERDTGVVRCVGASYPVRWTPEEEERERQRRARQRPPRPTKKAKTRGRKLLDLIGPGPMDE